MLNRAIQICFNKERVSQGEKTHLHFKPYLLNRHLRNADNGQTCVVILKKYYFLEYTRVKILTLVMYMYQHLQAPPPHFTTRIYSNKFQDVTTKSLMLCLIDLCRTVFSHAAFCETLCIIWYVTRTPSIDSPLNNAVKQARCFVISEAES